MSNSSATAPSASPPSNYSAPSPYVSPSQTEGVSNSSSSSGGTSSTPAIGGGTISAVVIVVAIISLCICWRRKRAKLASFIAGLAMEQRPVATAPGYNAPRPAPSGGVLAASNVGSSSQYGHQGFTYEQLSMATMNFSDSQMLGRGGSGSVYRGRLPEDGILVAVKSIPENSNQGMKEFHAEVSIISNLRHRNLVKLKGWCHDQGKCLLVYDYMPNGSLDYLLYDDAHCVNLMWARRYAIATGLGSALLYLHEECDRVIIHRDVKSSNVLLDENYVAKLGDFGLSRQVDVGVTSHMTTVVAGTRGYMAPECFVGLGKATQETDVYAFGAVLLEVVSGKRPLDARLQEYGGMLVDWVWDLFAQGRVLQAVDERLGGEWDAEEAKRMLVVGLACSHPDPQGRPKMRRALDALKGTVALPPVPSSKPIAIFGPSPPMSISQVMSPIGSNATTSSTFTGSSTHFSASSNDSKAFSNPPSHFAR